MSLNSSAISVSADPENPLSVEPLFCAFGGVGMAPPGSESEFAVAVVEITSPREINHVPISGFELIDRSGTAAKATRIVGIEVFDRTRIAAEGVDAYYLNPGGTTPWNGILPAGKIRLRIKVAMPGNLRPRFPVLFRLKVGSQRVEGLVNGGEWPT